MKLKLALSSLCAAVLLSGCSPIYYAPNTLNVPMIRAKGEGVVSGHIGDRSSLNFQGAYSPKQNWAVVADGFWASEGSAGTIEGRGHLITGGAGYYRPLNTHFMWDTYGILGFGSVKNTFAQRDVRSNFVRYGVQPSAGYQSKYFDAAVAARFVGLGYFNTNGSDPVEVQYLKDAGTQFLFEPALTLRGGYDFLKFQAQLGYSYNLTNSNFKQDEGILSFGVVYTFRRR